jgi:branched-chain amino acid transport system permease protein
MTLGLVALVLASKALVVVLCGLFVRIQLAIHRGFDLSLAAIVAACADIFIVISNHLVDGQAAVVALVVALAAVVLLGAGAGALWNATLTRLVRGAREPGYVVFLTSLGISTVTAGAVGLVRGPGLKVVQDWKLEGLGPFLGHLPAALLTALVLLLAGVAAASVWARSRLGFATALLAQDRAFAIEIGIDTRRIAATVGAVWGGIAAIVASAQAVLAGNTPESGLSLFLFGASAALLLPSSGLVGPVLSGICIGLALVLTQLMMPPSWAEPAVFAVIFGLVSIRGVDRAAIGLR